MTVDNDVLEMRIGTTLGRYNYQINLGRCFKKIEPHK